MKQRRKERKKEPKKERRPKTTTKLERTKRAALAWSGVLGSSGTRRKPGGTPPGQGQRGKPRKGKPRTKPNPRQGRKTGGPGQRNPRRPGKLTGQKRGGYSRKTQSGAGGKPPPPQIRYPKAGPGKWFPGAKPNAHDQRPAPPHGT